MTVFGRPFVTSGERENDKQSGKEKARASGTQDYELRLRVASTWTVSSSYAATY